MNLLQNIKFFIRLLLLGLIMFAPSNIIAQTPLDGIVAFVNDDVITKRQLQNTVNQLKDFYRETSPRVPSQTELEDEALQQLIDQQLQLGHAKDMGLKVDDAVVDNAIQQIRKDNNITLEQLKTAITNQGLTFNQYRENIRNQITIGQLQQQIIGPQITITKEAVDKLLKEENQNRFEPVYTIRNIIIPVAHDDSDEQKNAIKAKAESYRKLAQEGSNLTVIARDKSEDNFKLVSTELVDRKKSDLPSLYATIVGNMKQGQISELLVAGNGYHFIKVIKIENKATRPELSRQEAEQLAYQKMFQEKITDWNKQLRSTAYVKVVK